jgi:hypothetical protein
MSSWNIHDPTDLSALYFGDGNAGHDKTSHRNNTAGGVIYAGPIEVRQKQDGSGRGLFVTRDVKAGELLLIAQPLATASVQNVYDRWYRNQPELGQQGHAEEVILGDTKGGEHSAAAAAATAATTTITVSEASEQCLVDAIMARQRQNDASLCAALSFLQQQQQHPQPTPTGTSADGAAASDAGVIVDTDDMPLMRLLLGGGGGKQKHSSSWAPPPEEPVADPPSPPQYFWTVEEVTQIVRRNAFGPDFTTPQSIQSLWEQQKSSQQQKQQPEWLNDDDNDNENNSPSSLSPQRPFLPPRLLGLYALPAMINHSCLPNAVRVYVGDATMIVHACRDITIDNDEILWSYVPVVQPHRRRQLQQTHGFCCHCDRCVAEEGMMPLRDGDNGDNGDNGDDIIDDDNALPSSLSKKLTVAELEESILPSLSSNELRRYIRVSYLSVYLNEVNSSSQPPDHKRWIPLGMQLHLALAACHNASTEHLSVR